ncbi:MAG: hypothetical protein HUU10_03605 [Bacteroidetes bacterium]|nr:hypothetical protein [Bacteroidota bacterium]
MYRLFYTLIFILAFSSLFAQKASQVFYLSNGDSVEGIRIKGNSTNWFIQKRDGSVFETDSTLIVRIRQRQVAIPEKSPEPVVTRKSGIIPWSRLTSGTIWYTIEVGVGHPYYENEGTPGYNEEFQNLKLGFNAGASVGYDFLPSQLIELNLVYMYHFSQYQEWGKSSFQSGDPWHFVWVMAGPRLRQTVGWWMGIEVEAKAGFVWVSRPERTERRYFPDYSNVYYDASSDFSFGARAGFSLYAGSHFAISGFLYYSNPVFSHSVSFEESREKREDETMEVIILPVVSLQYRL